MVTQMKIAALMLVVLSALTGVVYPLLITGLSLALFPKQARGSLIVKDGKAVGSRLVGQPFTDPKYFWGRLSATGPFSYNAAASSGSNLGPLNENLSKAVAGRVAALRSADPENRAPVPVDVVTASGSGLDPHISPAAALFQVRRVARARGMQESEVRAIVDRHATGRLWGFLGEPVVNVLLVNLDLDGARPKSEQRQL